jgi:tol-pal system protein YbgF
VRVGYFYTSIEALMTRRLPSSAAFGFLLLAPALAGGCGTAAMQTRIDGINGRVQALESANQQKGDEIRDLQNRVEILSAQQAALDRTVTPSGAPTTASALPVVTLAPPPAPRPTSVGPSYTDGGPSAEQTPPLDAPSVVPLDPPPPVDPGPHPVITIDESQPPPPATAANGTRPGPAWSGYPDPASVSDTLSVVPLPDGPNRPTNLVAMAGAPMHAGAVTAIAGNDGETEAYQSAYARIQAGDYGTAQTELKAFLTDYPKSIYADNALYWLGETFYAQHQYDKALAEFETAVSQFPDGNKAPDALLKQALCYVNLGDRQAARDLFGEVIASFPSTSAASLASAKLQELK